MGLALVVCGASFVCSLSSPLLTHMATLLLGAAVVTAAGGAAASGAAAAAMYYRKKQQQKRAVFGKELEQLRERHLTGAPWYLPIVVEETVSWLEDNRA